MMLEKVKAALRITSTAFDADLMQLIHAALLDLGIAGVTKETAEVEPDAVTDPLVIRAVITYCGMNRINIDDAQRTWLKASYDEQKAQLATATGYTDWLVTADA